MQSPTKQPASTNPFGQHVLAWVNGSTVYTPLFGVSIRRKSPRTQFITMGVARPQQSNQPLQTA